MLDDLRNLAALAISAFVVAFAAYIGWDCARTLIVWVLRNFK